MTGRVLFLAGAITALTLTFDSPIAHAATCVGAAPCKACSNCHYCKRCAKDGKTCGTCKKAEAK